MRRPLEGLRVVALEQAVAAPKSRCRSRATMVGMRGAVEAIHAAGLPRLRVMVGGAPVTPEFAAQIGADAYAPDAASAVDVAKGAVAAG